MHRIAGKPPSFRAFTLLLIASTLPIVAVAAWGATAPRLTRRDAGREVRDQFFIVSEVNLPKHHIVFETPRQSTVLMRFDSKTVFLNRQGKREPVADIQAGDTVYVTYVEAGEDALAVEIRGGAMTVQVLHKRYWNG